MLKGAKYRLEIQPCQGLMFFCHKQGRLFAFIYGFIIQK